MFIGFFISPLILSAALAGGAEAMLDVAPHICVQNKHAAACTMEIEVTASSTNHSQLCIEIAVKKELKACYNSNKISVTYRVTLENTTTISLTNNDGEVLISKKLDVAKLATKNYRIRRRFGWGI
ncbi:hypothetical protein B1L02_16855 [Pseudoalteromonas piscicida]|uniref:DUF3019 domain-containing protein n=2 Tax=Pseudoalteromonas piscicida TaxID=43662 RepID=A0AAD0W4L0_PSEO7|nr:DUF3019 domain-containing protein [Pseudoalteromonas piscicida]ASD68519.1 hypothetical protein B1L02_16855 [Pseudoalteromonas piscicida]AXR03575.1 DUF3019 domain-containing protein [Pseudoalteromonas piscicida]